MNANDITDNLSIRISSIDGLPAEQVSKQKKISIMPQEEFNRLHGQRLKRMADWGWAQADLISPGTTTIGKKAFEQKQLTGVIIIPDSVTTIGESAFSLNQLTRVTIPDSVTTIGERAFSSNRLTSITIGAYVSLDSVSFFGTNFDSLYNRNGQKAGTYIHNGREWSFTPR